MRHVIVGIDPGKTSAIACIDLDGRVVLLASKRFAGLTWFVASARGAGSPVVIASDKKRPVDTVSKIAAIFDAVLFVPESDISVSKKKAVQREDESVENLHQRDALTAARVAYNHYSNKLKQAERLAREKGSTEIDEVKAMVIRKYSVSEALTKKKTGRRLVRR